MKSKVNPVEKAKLNKLFSLLRKEGYIAKQAFMCCSSCASAQFAYDVKDMDAGTKFDTQGAVFYHKQDRDRMHETGKLMLRFGPVMIDSAMVGESSFTCGMQICYIMSKLGMTYEWDQNPNSCIEVNLL